MKKIILILVLGLNLAACKSGTGSGDDSKQPLSSIGIQEPKKLTTIQWLDSAKQVGKVTEGEKVEIAYRFVNTGNQPLVIESVTPTCGCTIAEKPEQPIAPGKEGFIKAIFDSKGRVGSQHKSLTVYANTEAMTYPLTFEVDVIATNKQ